MSVIQALQGWVLGLFLIGLAFSITLSQSALALLVILWFVRLWDPAVRASQSFPLAAPVLVFAGATLLSALSSGNPVASLVDSKSLLLLAAFYVVLDALSDVDAADRFLNRLFILLVIVAGLGVIQVTVCPQDPWGLPLLSRFFRRCDRAHAFYSIYMTLAGVLNLALLAILPQLFLRAGRRRWWMLLAWAVSALGLLLTYARQAWVGFLAGATALAFLLRRISLVLAMGVVLVLAFILLPAGTLGDRIRSLGDLSDPTFRERLYMWQSGLGIVRDHPLTGVGVGQLKTVYPQYARPGAVKKTTSHVHNTPLQILAERGPLGLAAWLWIWAAFFVRGVRVVGRIGPGQLRDRALVVGSLGAMVGFLVSGLFEYNFGDSEVVMVAYALMALPFVVERSLDSTTTNQQLSGSSRTTL